MLAFILGLWMWDHYLGPPEGYQPGTEKLALVKIDCDLRLADAMVGDPAWLRWMAGVNSPSEARKQALDALEKLADDQSLTQAGLAAYTVVFAVDQGKSVVSSWAQAQLPAPDFRSTEERLKKRQGSWWDARLLENWQKRGSSARAWQLSDGAVASGLRTRTIIVRSAVWLLALAGFAFLPSTVRRMDDGLKVKVRGFGSGWTPAMGLTIFLVATLAWIGFGMALDLSLRSAGGIPGWLAFSLDTATRLLPTLIAVALIFRRPVHAGRVMGIRKKIHPGMILGLFSLLTLLDQPVRLLFDNGSAEPGGGLAVGENGWLGLVVMIFSSCLLAPFAEELLYRGVLFRSFANRIGVTGGALVSSAIFALLHFYDGYGLVSVGLFGFACAVLYASTRSLTTVILFHVLYNLTIKLPEWAVYQWPLG